MFYIWVSFHDYNNSIGRAGISRLSNSVVSPVGVYEKWRHWALDELIRMKEMFLVLCKFCQRERWIFLYIFHFITITIGQRKKNSCSTFFISVCRGVCINFLFSLINMCKGFKFLCAQTIIHSNLDVKYFKRNFTNIFNIVISYIVSNKIDPKAERTLCIFII